MTRISMSKEHKCFTQISEQLEPHNTELVFGFSLTHGTTLYLATQTIIKKKGRAGRAKQVLCTFCPFCGERIIKE